MRKISVILIVTAFLLIGCDSLRFAPGETQKQNAWLHNRTAIAAAAVAQAENSSEKLQTLTKLSELQSRAFNSYYGLPKEFPQAGTVDSLLAESNFQLAEAALTESADRPNAFALADNLFEIAIGLSVLLGGVYGTRAARFLTTAKVNSQALREIIAGNEVFKKTNAESAEAFKQAQKNQSPATRQIVAQLKT